MATETTETETGVEWGIRNGGVPGTWAVGPGPNRWGIDSERWARMVAAAEGGTLVKRTVTEWVEA